jgi:site-specific recombinase XerD
VINIDELTADVIRKYLLELSTHRNKGGVHAAYRAVRAFMKFHWGENEIDKRNPIDKVTVPSPSVVPLPGIEIENVRVLIDHCQGNWVNRDKTIICALLDTAARAEEFINLNVGDVNYSTGSVQIHSGKGDKPRTVFLGMRTLKMVKKYLIKRQNITENMPLFITEQGTRFTKSGLREIIRRRSKDAGIHCPGLHDFRRCCALSMLRAGVGIETVSRYLGHSSIAITMRYLALVTDDLQEAHRRGSPVDNARL